ncbi:PD-(D/E)XK nuclease family protein [Marinovum sp. 2_MG-2023]|uniref:PDDEXK-like family protein n=1 Tax=unclassified Marinovum TaxID=2647166 RepID=UPI0026E23548|nr:MULTISPECIES: PD-(D/E)XK nuclease family protein [unclassified Marinovum]MDO6731525.1 PD-(D/E)XK nuclease family protein [Marinovum sp. 2_MG-2023]MDO6780885.1 PD-(D/E)XK nuclease family protein [Marinovum sp. 1_MG-2023]
MNERHGDLHQKISDLFDGAGASQLDLVARHVRHFCPFEAIGMARQEIRHSNFLSYIMDPGRPHEMGDLILRTFFQLLCDKSGDRGAQLKLAQNGTSLAPARVYRERDHIDLLIEIPRSGTKGIVIAVELKVDAVERNDQLVDYEEKVALRYPATDWERLFCFLTPDGRAATTDGETKWAALSFTSFFASIDKALAENTIAGKSLELLRDYQSMMRRHGMADGPIDKTLKAAIESIWAEHREVLEYLIAHEPDPLNDLMHDFANAQPQIAHDMSAALGLSIVADSSWGARWYRFTFPEFGKTYPALSDGDRGWIDSGSQMAVELCADTQEDAITVCFCIGPGHGEQIFRPKLIEAFNEIGQYRHKPFTKSVKHYWRQNLLTTDSLSDAENGLEKLQSELVQYVERHLPKVKAALIRAQDAHGKADDPAAQSI